MYLVNGLHGEVECHELDDRPQSVEGRPNAETGEAQFGDWGVNHTLVSILLPQASCHLKRKSMTSEEQLNLFL